jgi:aminoglycoside 6'-N-acetyltransferase Ib
VSIARSDGRLRFGEFYLLPALQRQGLGTRILTSVLADAEAEVRTVELEHLKWNPVGSLYRRHGFVMTGESESHVFMARRPVAADIAFDPLAPEDFARLHAWLQRAHIATRWKAPATVAGLAVDYGPTLARDDSTRAWIARLNDRTIGFVQIYVPANNARWWPESTDPGARGVDLFLAEADDLGRGLGSALLGAVCKRLFDDPGITRIQVDPSPGNARAIRCFARAGFVARGEIATPDGPALLMERARLR